VLGLIESAVLICKDQSISYRNYCAFTLLLSNVVQIKKNQTFKNTVPVPSLTPLKHANNSTCTAPVTQKNSQFCLRK
jgi:hypothetical protein